MNRILAAFYRFLLWATDRELVIARSTGRNPANINQLQREVEEYKLALFKLEHSL